MSGPTPRRSPGWIEEGRRRKGSGPDAAVLRRPAWLRVNDQPVSSYVCVFLVGITGSVPVLYRAGWGCHPGRVRPRIRYCATPAGRVAYSTAGAGPALLCDSGWITDLRGQLELFSFGGFIVRLAERFTVIRFDKPGCGLSDREGVDLSFDGQVAAALAVADAAGAGRFGLFGASQGGQLAAAIAAVSGQGRGPGAVRNVRQRQRSGACRGPGLGRGAGAGPLGPGAEGAGRGVRHRSHRRGGGGIHPVSAGQRLGRGEDLARLSPFVRHHLGVHGRYSFVPPDLAGGIRPLRDPDAGDDDRE